MDELYGFAYKNGTVLVVGKVEQERDHGISCWLCCTMPPLKQLHEVVSSQQDAIDWLRCKAGAEQVFFGRLVEAQSKGIPVDS